MSDAEGRASNTSMAGKRSAEVEENGKACSNHTEHAETPQKRQKRGYENWYSWGVDEVCDFLREHGLDEVIPTFIGEQISGSVLPSITEDILAKMDIEPMGLRLKVLQVLKQLDLYAIQTTPPFSQIHDRFKVFNDPIHGHVEMHPLCITIIDTPQFQRLRYIKQLGGCYFVFPGATHNRFEHSIGVAWLAGQLLQALRSRQPQLGITEADILCVTIAGLCHDLGHGPFSHMFDGWFIPTARPGYDWKHEHASVQMFEYLIEDNKLKEVFEEYGLDDKDITFIKEQIRGPYKGTPSQGWPYEGRPKEKGFLYEIVANKRNGIDVDKWDYFARDCHHLGINNNFDHKRFMKFARVINVDGQLQICSRDKEVGDLYDLFYTRNVLHRRAYQHKNKNIIEEMITEAMLKADGYLKYEGKDGKMLKISETIDDMVAYTKLTDVVFHQILQSTSPELKGARNILRMVEQRQLYKCVGQTHTKPGFRIEKNMIDGMKTAIVNTPPCDDEIDFEKLKPEDIVIQLVKMDYGMKDKNPIDNVRFYLKSNPEVPIQVRKDQVSQMLPEQFMEQHLRVYCKKRDETSVSLATQCFNRWCSQQDHLTKPKGGDIPIDMTPIKLSQGSHQDSFTTPQKTGIGQRSHSFQNRLSF